MAFKVLFLFLLSINCLFSSTQTIKVSYDPDYSPFSYSMEEKPFGLLIDLWKEWGKENQINIEFVNGQNWENAVLLLENKKVDFFLGTNPYEKWMIGSTPIYETETTIFSLKDSLDTISSIGIIGDDYKEELLEIFPQTTISSYETYEELINALINKNVVAIYDDNLAINDFITHKRLNHIITQRDIYNKKNDVCAISYSKSKIELFNKGLKKLSKEKLYEIEQNWVLNSSHHFYNNPEYKLSFTQNEQKWLEKHPSITVHNEKSWEPINFNNNGIPTGFSIEYMNLLAQKIGIKIKYITGEWNDLYNQALNKKLDVMLNIAKSKQREKFFLFTSQYQTNNIGIFAKTNDNYIKSLESLNGKKVTIVDGFYHESMLRNEFPLIQVIPVKDSKEALKQVCDNKADATIGSFIVNNHMINKMLCQNIEYKLPFSAEKDIGLHIAVRNDYPELHSILQKAMADVGANEMNKIRKKWITTKSTQNNLQLSAQELAWIRKHPVVDVAGELDWAPIDFVTEDGEYTGLAKDYLDYISKQTGIKFKIHTGLTWSEILKEFKNRKFDLLPSLYHSKEREEFLSFSKPYFALTEYYITKKNHPKIENIKELYGKKVVGGEGYHVTKWLEKNHPQIEIIKVNSSLEAMRVVEVEDAVAFIASNAIASHLIKTHYLSNLKLNNIVKLRPPSPLRMAVQKNNHELVSILNKVFMNMEQKEKEFINSQWIQLIDNNTKVLNLSQEEIDWVKKQPTIKFAIDPNWLPIEGIDQETNSYTGMMSDYLKTIAKITGINFELVATQKWAESIDLAQSRKVDMLAAASITPQREKYLNFSKTTFTLNDGVIMKSDAKFISDLNELQGLKVGIASNTALHRLVEEKYPKLKLIPIKGTENGIMQVEDNKIDAYIGNLEVISYIIFQKNLLDLKAVYRLDNTRELHIALHKEYPKEALSIINKAIDSISNEELNLIKQKWVALTINDEIDYMLFVKIALGVLALIAFFIYNNRKLQKMVEVRTQEISKQKDELENLSKNLEKLVEERTKELDNERNYVSSVMNSQENIVISTDGEKIRTANQAFFKFYKINSLEEFFDKYGECICDTFDIDTSKEFIQKEMHGEKWVEYIYLNHGHIHKVQITLNQQTYIFSITIDKFFHNNEKLDVAVFTDITELEHIQKELQEVHKHTQDSIEYASLIQHALIPEKELFDRYFEDYFTIWKPKDIVGGDIYLFEHLRNDNECILMIIDCTGHGVPGAFVTMLVKAIERQLISKYINNEDLEVNTAWILSYFNKSMKKLLKQEDISSISNAGFDGGILYYNKLQGIIKYSGAETPLFYFDENDNLQMIKGDRHSIGYKKSDLNYQFKEHTIPVKKGMRFYLTTDGYLDQNGGDKGFPFGKKRFKEIIDKNHTQSFSKQKKVLLDSLQEYQNAHETNDDISVVGLQL